MTVKLWDLDATKEPVEITKFGIQATGVFLARRQAPRGVQRLHEQRQPRRRGPGLRDRHGQGAARSLERKGAQAIAFSPDGKQIATGGVGAKALRLYDVQTGKLLREVEGATPSDARVLPRRQAVGHAHSTGGRHGGSSVQIWDTATWQEKAALVEHTRLVLGLGFSADGKHLATASNDRR